MDAPAVRLKDLHPVEGPVSLVATGASNAFVSGGADGEIKLSEASTPEFGSDASVAFSALSGAGTTLVTGDEEVTALAVSPAGDELLVGLADGSVNSHALPSGDLLATITRFPAAAARAVGYLGNSLYLAASEEPGLRVMARANPVKVMMLDESSDVGSRSLCADPCEEYVCAVSLDGRLKVHYVPKGPYANGGLPDSLDVETSVLDEPCMIRDDGSEAAQEQRGLCAWHPTGACLALAGRSSVLLKHRPGAQDGNGAAAASSSSSEDLDRSVWREEVLVGGNGPPHAAGVVTTLAWSPCGRFLASGGTDRQVVLWSFDTKDVVASWSPSTHALTGLAFLVNPSISEEAAAAKATPLLALADARGRVGVWGVNPKLGQGNKKGSSAAAAEVDSDNESPLKLKRASQGRRLKKTAPTPSKGSDEFDTDDEKAKMGFVSSKALLDVANDDDDEDFDFVTDDEAEKIAGGQNGNAAGAVAKSPAIDEDEEGVDDELKDGEDGSGAKGMEDDEAEDGESKIKQLSAKERLAAAMAPATEAQEESGKTSSKSAEKKAAKNAKLEAKKAKKELKLKKKQAKKDAAAAGGSDESDDADFNDSAEEEDLDSDEGSDSDNALNSASEDEDDVKAYASTDKKSSKEDAASSSGSKKSSKATTKAALNDSDDENNSDDAGSAAGDYDSDNDGINYGGDDDMLDDQDNDGYGAAGAASSSSSPGAPGGSVVGGMVAAAPASFMPSASPLGEERRYLCWNSVGTITSRLEGAANAVEIEFADAASRRSVRFQDRFELSMGSLSDDCALFANVPEPLIIDQEPDGVTALTAFGVSDRLRNVLASEAGLLSAGGNAYKQQLSLLVQQQQQPGSVLYCSVFNATTQQGASWTRKLPPGEVAACVAAGHGWCACVTTTGLVRIFGLGGLEIDVLHAPCGAHVLTCVGSGRKLLLVSQASSAAAPTFVVLDVLRRRRLAHGALPLEVPTGPAAVATTATAGASGADATAKAAAAAASISRARSTLQWVGFAEPHTVPCLLDSGGLLSGLTSAYGGATWAPWCNTSLLAPSLTSRRDSLWPVAVQHGSLNAVLLKNSSNSGSSGFAGPAIMPRPLVSSYPLSVPACEGIDQALVSWEAQALTHGTLRRGYDARCGGKFYNGEAAAAAEAAQADKVAADKTMLKLMQAACAAQRYEAALDAVRQLSLPASLQIALVVANHAELATLAPKVQDIIDEMQAEAEAEAASGGHQEDDDDDQEVLAASAPTPPAALPRRAPRPATVTPRLSGLVSRRQLDAQQQEQERQLALQEQQLQEEQEQGRRQQQRARPVNRVSFGQSSSKRSALAAVVSPPKAEEGGEAGSFSDDEEDGGEEVDVDTADEGEVGEDGVVNGGGAEEEEEEEEGYELANNEDELQQDSPPASPVKKAKPFNPFGKKDHGVMASPPKKRRNVFELLAATASPSPKKAPKLATKASAMVKSAHSKRNKLRGVL